MAPPVICSLFPVTSRARGTLRANLSAGHGGSRARRTKTRIPCRGGGEGPRDRVEARRPFARVARTRLVSRASAEGLGRQLRISAHLHRRRGAGERHRAPGGRRGHGRGHPPARRQPPLGDRSAVAGAVAGSARRGRGTRLGSVRFSAWTWFRPFFFGR